MFICRTCATMSTKEPYKPLPRLPPPPSSPRAKPALKKTVSAPQTALTRLLGRQGAAEESRGVAGGEGKGSNGGRVAKRRKKAVEVGEDVLATELTPPSEISAQIPEGNLIDLDPNDANLQSSASLSSRTPLRSASMSGRFSPQLRRPPPPPPERVRLATVTGGPLINSSGLPKNRPPKPPPKPSYLTSKPESSSLVSESDSNETTSEITSRPDPKPRSIAPSPYLTFTPKTSKPQPPPKESSHSIPNPSADSLPHFPMTRIHQEPITATKNSASDPSTDSLLQLPIAPRVKRPTHVQPVTYPNPSPREMDYTEREHARNVFDYLNQMRGKGDLCDVTLVGGGSREIRAHKAVLAACSPYFESMFIGEFSEPDGEPVIIEEVEDDALEALVNFAYTSQIRLTDRNIYLIFEAADLLQFSRVRAACFKFFKQQMNKSNCIRTWLFADGHNCTELLDAAIKYIECNFLDIVHGREFMSIDRADVVAKLLALEDIAVTSEEQVYEAALNWLRHDLEGRTVDAAVVMKSVRFPNMSRDYLLHIVETEDVIKENSDCLQMLIEALESFVTGSKTRRRKKMRESEYSNVKPRTAAMAVETVEFCRGDHESLGLRIMGGSERPYHVFRQGDKPGIFILMVTSGGAAAKTGRLRTGDRILKVNGTDVSTATHDKAIRLLKTSPGPLCLLVRHEPAPHGLQELTLVTKPGEGFGISLSGGVNGYHGNPLDETDEGIFISQIVPGGAAERDGRLKEGTRILQVNSISMLGKTHAEALQVLQGVLDRINLLVCFGYDPRRVPLWQGDGEGGGEDETTVDGFGYVGNESLYDHKISSEQNGLLV